MKRAILSLLASNAGMFVCADDGSEGANTGGGRDGTYDPSKGADTFTTGINEAVKREVEAFKDEFFGHLDEHMKDISERLAKIEAVQIATVGDVSAHPASKMYEDLRALVLETRGHVDNLSRDVSSLRRG